MKKVKKAVALSYEKSYSAPIVTAAGMGYVAEKILKTAEENKVPVVEDEDLTELLVNLQVNSAIPGELYEAVASIIAYVMNIDSKLRR
ncbi:MAG TPA: EscU/YscU/HrcU family type III secretion system export apparatus switch protein [Clostridiaceae bacterium]